MAHETPLAGSHRCAKSIMGLKEDIVLFRFLGGLLGSSWLFLFSSLRLELFEVFGSLPSVFELLLE
jgi:hypothetical protein